MTTPKNDDGGRIYRVEARVVLYVSAPHGVAAKTVASLSLTDESHNAEYFVSEMHSEADVPRSEGAWLGAIPYGEREDMTVRDRLAERSRSGR